TRTGGENATEITARLEQWHIPFKHGENGALLVPANEVLDTRMRLVSEGIPNRGTVGFELFDKTDYGMTAFAQRINYQRALQGELERTIISLQGVRDARVALSLGKKTLFATQEDPPKGSVTLSLRPGAKLTRKQVEGIRNLVASAVTGLSADNVMVLDEHGNILTRSGPDGASLGSRLEAKRQYETTLRNKIQNLLVKVFGARNFAISVDAAFAYSDVKNVETRILPAGNDGNGLIRSRKQSNSRRGDSKAGDGDHGNSKAEIEYLHGKSVRRTTYAPGRLKRLSVGVVVPPDMTAKQLARLREVAAAAAGIDQARGDRITVAAFNIAQPKPEQFIPEASSPVAEPPATAYSSSRSGVWLRATSLPVWSLAILTACAMLLVLALLAQLRARFREPRRLQPPARQALLNELGSWLNEPSDEAAIRE
ncbi:MAG TPA: flagellar basal-body MS-ring/collar protein FliF, partial [Gammaproteobacteria bacterium]|nr:flagellar basal-body MS-ring/collar protein FliF [Gammaproteobacteria bacterium]